jgi:hypothetical protein
MAVFINMYLFFERRQEETMDYTEIQVDVSCFIVDADGM